MSMLNMLEKCEFCLTAHLPHHRTVTEEGRVICNPCDRNRARKAQTDAGAEGAYVGSTYGNPDMDEYDRRIAEPEPQ